jgi:hypothetical protein
MRNTEIIPLKVSNSEATFMVTALKTINFAKYLSMVRHCAIRWKVARSRTDAVNKFFQFT